MIPVRQSDARREIANLVKRPRLKNGKKWEGNTDWVQRVTEGSDLSGRILLLGGTRLDDFRLRVAQSHARSDLMPSFWSHVAIVSRSLAEQRSKTGNCTKFPSLPPGASALFPDTME